MKIQELFEGLNRTLIEIGKGLTVPNTSMLPFWNALVAQVVCLKLNIEGNETQKYHVRLESIKEIIPQAKAEITPCLEVNNDHLFAELTTKTDRFCQWVDDNIPQINAPARR